jgi:hypothetical protein
MKKEGLLLIFLALIMCFNTSIKAQQKSGPEFFGNNLIIPYSMVFDSTKSLKVDVRRELLLNVEKLICTKKECLVISFSFLTAVNGDMVSYKGSGNALTPEMRKVIPQLKPGAKIWIEKITIKEKDGKTGRLEDVVLFIE